MNRVESCELARRIYRNKRENRRENYASESLEIHLRLFVNSIDHAMYMIFVQSLIQKAVLKK